MGYLYYGNYALYYEIGRVELLRALGMTYRSLESEHAVVMPVAAMQIRFVRPALYDDLVAIRTEIRKLPERDIVFHYELFGEAGRLLNGASVRLCFMNAANGKRIGAPTILTQLLTPHFG